MSMAPDGLRFLRGVLALSEDTRLQRYAVITLGHAPARPGARCLTARSGPAAVPCSHAYKPSFGIPPSGSRPILETLRNHALALSKMQ